MDSNLIHRINSIKSKYPELPDRRPTIGDKIGFVFSTKDRIEYTLRSLKSIDSTIGFDLVWVDGSDEAKAQQLPYEYEPKYTQLVEIHSNVRGGPDNAIRFGMKRLLDLGYKYCGLIENDIVFQPGWFEKLKELFYLGAADGLKVGAATVRNFTSRVIEYRPNYTINWNMGAGMVLFTREAAQLIFKYKTTTARRIYRFYAERLGIDLKQIWELWYGKFNRSLGADWCFSPILYDKGLSSIGSIPSYAYDLDLKPETFMKSSYVATFHQSESSNMAIPFIKSSTLWKMRLDPVYYIDNVFYKILAAIRRKMGKHK